MEANRRIFRKILVIFFIVPNFCQEGHLLFLDMGVWKPNYGTDPCNVYSHISLSKSIENISLEKWWSMSIYGIVIDIEFFPPTSYLIYISLRRDTLNCFCLSFFLFLGNIFIKFKLWDGDVFRNFMWSVCSVSIRNSLFSITQFPDKPFNFFCSTENLSLCEWWPTEITSRFSYCTPNRVLKCCYR